MSLISRAKRLVGDNLFRCLDCSGRYRLRVSQRKALAVLMYHGLETDPNRSGAGFHWVTPEDCLKEIRFFQRQGYQLISAGEIDDLHQWRNDKCAGYLLVTFDDGHANIFPHVKRWLELERIPVLLGICPGVIEESGIYWWEEVRARFQLMKQSSIQIKSLDGTALSFARVDEKQFEESGREVPHLELEFRLGQLREQTSYIGREQLTDSVYVHENMNWHQVTELAKHPLCALASHSMHHEIATQLGADELARRTKTSLELIESKTGGRVRHYIYPNGRLSGETDRVLAGLGILHTYSVKAALNTIPAGFRLDRVKGYEYGSRNLWNYGRRWEKWHPGQL